MARGKGKEQKRNAVKEIVLAGIMQHFYDFLVLFTLCMTDPYLTKN